MIKYVLCILFSSLSVQECLGGWFGRVDSSKLNDLSDYNLDAQDAERRGRMSFFARFGMISAIACGCVLAGPGGGAIVLKAMATGATAIVSGGFAHDHMEDSKKFADERRRRAALAEAAVAIKRHEEAEHIKTRKLKEAAEQEAEEAHRKTLDAERKLSESARAGVETRLMALEDVEGKSRQARYEAETKVNHISAQLEEQKHKTAEAMAEAKAARDRAAAQEAEHQRRTDLIEAKTRAEAQRAQEQKEKRRAEQAKLLARLDGVQSTANNVESKRQEIGTQQTNIEQKRTAQGESLEQKLKRLDRSLSDERKTFGELHAKADELKVEAKLLRGQSTEVSVTQPSESVRAPEKMLAPSGRFALQNQSKITVKVGTL